MARREESINTHQEKYESALDRLQADMVEHDDDMARRFANFAKQRKDNLRWQIGISIVGIVVLGAVLRCHFDRVQSLRRACVRSPDDNWISTSTCSI